MQGIEFSEKRDDNGDDVAATLEPLFPVLKLVSRTTFPRRTTHAGSKSTTPALKELEREGEARADNGGSAMVALSGGENGEQVCVNVDDDE